MEDEATDNLDFRNWEASRVNDDGSIEIPDEAEGSRVIERAPRIPARGLSGLSDRAKEFVANRQKGGSKAENKPVKRAVSRSTKPRASVSNVISWGWEMLGRVAQPVSIPVARTIAMQAPVAGEVLEDVVKGTAIDKLLQPLARVGEGSEAVFALLGPPVLVGVIERNPAMAPALLPLLRSSLVSWVKIAGPKLEEKQQEETEFEQKYGKTVDAIMAAIFANLEENNGEPSVSDQVTAMGPVSVPPPAPVPTSPQSNGMPHPMKAPVRPTARATRVPRARQADDNA